MSTEKQTHGFQAEVSRLLHLMIHSLYSNREIFLRELISNASDACDKLRFSALDNPGLAEAAGEPAISLSVDKEAGTLAITDNGIGMDEADVIENLGTIARSGTEKFLASLSGDQKQDSQLIGQFGVGFYSAFIVADKVTVETRKAGADDSSGVRWESDGKGEFTVEPVQRDQPGTSVILHLREDAQEFLDPFKLRQVVNQYSDHVAFPIRLLTPAEGDQDASEETLNSATALWQRPKADISDEEYQGFYKHISHDFQDAQTWSHNKVEGKLEYTSLLYLPTRAPYDLWNRDAARGLKLYVQRIFIMDDAEQFLPLYLRFIKGVVDSNDISLNVSREILQKDPAVDSMRSALTKRALDMLAKLRKKDKQEYGKFWLEFGQVLKEGPGEDFSNREKIAKLLQFTTSESKGDAQDQGLEDYVNRMQEGQEKIYYLVAESVKAGRHSPHLEIFRKKGIEVILMYDRIDEWLMSQLHEFDGKQFQDIARGELDLGKLENKKDKAQQEKSEKKFEDLVTRIKTHLGDQVKEVRVSHRLIDSPGCLAVDDHDMGAQMRKIMAASGQAVPETKPIFEVNPDHPLVKKLDKESDEERFEDLVVILFGQASLADGVELADAADFTSRLNKLLLEAA